MSANVTLPDTGPSNVTLIQSYSDATNSYSNGDEVYVYVGGDAVAYGTDSYLDAGVQLGHTGNAGWLPYYNLMTVSPVPSGDPGGTRTKTRNQGVLGSGQMIPCGSVGMTFAAPGYAVPGNGTIADEAGLLLISPSAGAGDSYPITLGVAWQHDWKLGIMRTKCNVSIAQNLRGPAHPQATFTAPNVPYATTTARTASIYTSGSFLIGVQISALRFHPQRQPSGTMPPVQTNPGAPYVTGQNIRTVSP